MMPLPFETSARCPANTSPMRPPATTMPAAAEALSGVVDATARRVVRPANQPAAIGRAGSAAAARFGAGRAAETGAPPKKDEPGRAPGGNAKPPPHRRISGLGISP